MDIRSSKILVTGASGSLGKQLAYEFSKMGVRPVAHVRETSDTSFIDSLGLEKRHADLRNKEELRRLVEGIDAVIHTAAWVNFRQDRLTQFTAINTFGAVELYRAAAKAGVGRFVQLSSVVAVGAVRRKGGDGLGTRGHVDEEHDFNLARLRIPYIQTKRAAEDELATLAAGSQTELVTVNPSVIVAPSRTGDDRAKAIRSFRYPILPSLFNRVNLVDIRDVAPGVIAALERGCPGERYILAGDNITIRDLVLTISVLIEKSPQLIHVPRPVFDFAARFAAAFARLTGKGKVSFYPDLVKMMDYDWAYSSRKAGTELGYYPRPIHTTLEDLLTNNFTDSYMKPTN